MASTPFLELAETVQNMDDAPYRRDKILLCSAYLGSLQTDRDLELSAQFLTEGPFPASSGTRLSVGSRTYSTCAAAFCNIDYEKVFKPCKKALGDAVEAIEKLMANIEDARRKRNPASLTLPEIQSRYEMLYQQSSRRGKQQILRESWASMTPLEIKYFIRIMQSHPLPIHFGSEDMTEALACAFDLPAGRVHYTRMITGSWGRTAILCKNGRIEEATFSPFTPLDLMFPSPFQAHSEFDSSNFVAEEKFNGLRTQVHIKSSQVRLYSPDHGDITQRFPDVVQFFVSLGLPGTVLDGELCSFRNNKLLPFSLIQKRLKSKGSNPDITEKYPVLFIAFDILFDHQKLTLNLPFSERRKLLERRAARYAFPITNQFNIPSRHQIKPLYDQALARGNEGLILKRKDSSYKYGQRDASWLKMEKPPASLQAVIMYAHTDRRKRGRTYSAFTLGIRVDTDDRYEEEFIPIGKARGNLARKVRSRLNRKVKEYAVEKYGPTLGLLPKIVVELEYDDIQVNKRTKANYVLYKPRFSTIRWELAPSDTDSLERVEQLYLDNLEGHQLGQHSTPSFVYQNSN
ncbi:hypothetical protein [Fodinibius sediminis]|uniref:ATP-dependent DNA ligase n=1 Tax=Fodinibius sediminis TaxID=1214077 RepID=A0A521C4R0_9BACT|nr:hypothetical protein [Fodinibius sediminis]SMO54394.1 ATP-dependent DNA ligase [Fodinibius sediminis]